MDLAKQLVRSCVRAFFDDPKHILVVDALVIHSAYVAARLILGRKVLTKVTDCAMTMLLTLWV